MQIDKEQPNKPASEQATSEGSIKPPSRSECGAVAPVKASTSVDGVETASNQIQPSVSPKSAERLVDAVSTKMEVATEIFKRMRKIKGVTRKGIIEQFVAEAKLSKAGAATYYQLIKAKVK